MVAVVVAATVQITVVAVNRDNVPVADTKVVKAVVVDARAAVVADSADVVKQETANRFFTDWPFLFQVFAINVNTGTITEISRAFSQSAVRV